MQVRCFFSGSKRTHTHLHSRFFLSVLWIQTVRLVCVHSSFLLSAASLSPSRSNYARFRHHFSLRRPAPRLSSSSSEPPLQTTRNCSAAAGKTRETTIFPRRAIDSRSLSIPSLFHLQSPTAPLPVSLNPFTPLLYSLPVHLQFTFWWSVNLRAISYLLLPHGAIKMLLIERWSWHESALSTYFSEIKPARISCPSNPPLFKQSLPFNSWIIGIIFVGHQIYGHFLFPLTSKAQNLSSNQILS